MSDPESFGDIPAEEPEGPTLLGASPTIEAARTEKRKRQRVKRRRSEGRRSSTGGPVEFIYEPHVAVVPPLRNYFSDLYERRAFLVELARSEIRGKRSNTALGSLWALLDPLFMASIYFFLFTIIRGGGGRSTDFVPLIVNGVLLFQIAGGAITQGGISVRSGKSLMLNSTFPRALLPLSAVYKLILGFIPAIPIILISILAFNNWDPTQAFSVHLLWFFPLFFVQIITSIGLAMTISTLVVFLKDVSNLMQYVSRLLFFSTPIVYPWGLLGPEIINIVRWQPLFGLFVNYQKILDGTRPDFGIFAIAAVWSGVLICFGFWIFLRYERQFASRI